MGVAIYLRDAFVQLPVFDLFLQLNFQISRGILRQGLSIASEKSNEVFEDRRIAVQKDCLLITLFDYIVLRCGVA